MKNTFKNTLIVISAFLLVLICIINVSAETIYNYNGYSYYNLTNTTASLCGWDDRSPELNIPKEILENYIVEISDSAFENDSIITSVSFSKATMLERIGSYSFNKCSNLSGGFTIPQKVNSLGISAFQECTSLEQVRMKSSYISTISSQAFYKCTSLNVVVLPDELKTINKLAFANCTSLSEITIPKSVTSINSTAFNNDNIVIKGYRDSYAQQFAEDNGYDFYILDPLYGDSNADGKVNILDVTAIQRYKIGEQELNEYGMRCADVNHDGSITVRDATLIQMKLAKYDVDF